MIGQLARGSDVFRVFGRDQFVAEVLTRVCKFEFGNALVVRYNRLYIRSIDFDGNARYTAHPFDHIAHDAAGKT